MMKLSSRGGKIRNQIILLYESTHARYSKYRYRINRISMRMIWIALSIMIFFPSEYYM